jgi:hypothetical protein
VGAHDGSRVGRSKGPPGWMPARQNSNDKGLESHAIVLAASFSAREFQDLRAMGFAAGSVKV